MQFLPTDFVVDPNIFTLTRLVSDMEKKLIVVILALIVTISGCVYVAKDSMERKLYINPLSAETRIESPSGKTIHEYNSIEKRVLKSTPENWHKEECLYD